MVSCCQVYSITTHESENRNPTLAQTLPNTDRFSKFFTVGLSNKRVMIIRSHPTSNTSLYYFVNCKCHETNDNLEEMACLTINLNLI